MAIDFGMTGSGETQYAALSAVTEALQRHVDALDNHDELPWPTHRLVAEASLVQQSAHGIGSAPVDTRINDQGGNCDLEHQGDEDLDRHGRHAKRG